VTKIAWYNEDRSFAAAYSDGVVAICDKYELVVPVTTEAHQVCMFT